MPNQTPTRSSQQPSRPDRPFGSNQPPMYTPQPDGARRFVTVSIPDLRAQDFASLTSFDTEPAKPPVNSKLESIRSTIEESKSNENAATTTATQRPSDLQSVAARLRMPTNPDAKTNSYLNDVDTADPQLQSLVQSILEVHPSGGSTIIMLAGSERNPLLEVTAARTAVAIQSKTNAKILLIDSDFESGGLTGKLDCTGQFGLSDMINGQHDWRQTLRPTSKPKIDFIPVGKGRIESVAQGNTLLKTNLANISAGYSHVFVNVGDAHGIAATSWSHYVSGTYLLVSLTRSNQTIAKSAVSQLTTFGARLLGCIVSDVGE